MQAPEEKDVEEPMMLEEPTEGAAGASRFDYDAMLQAETKAKAPAQPKRGADGHLTFDTDGALEPTQVFMVLCLPKLLAVLWQLGGCRCIILKALLSCSVELKLCTYSQLHSRPACGKVFEWYRFRSVHSESVDMTEMAPCPVHHILA